MTPNKNLEKNMEFKPKSKVDSVMEQNLLKKTFVMLVALIAFGFNSMYAQNWDYPIVYVEGGTFTMGYTSEQGNNRENNEDMPHQVTVGSFNIGKYEVTRKQWRDIMGSNTSGSECDNCPVTSVSWDDVQDFIKKLNARTGKNYRLPTEAEWEYAARGGNKSKGYKYSGSNNANDVAWYYDNSDERSQPVGKKQANELGIHDMSGNVWEWCSSTYIYDNVFAFRGGSYKLIERGIQIAVRAGELHIMNMSDVGFRLVLLD